MYCYLRKTLFLSILIIYTYCELFYLLIIFEEKVVSAFALKDFYIYLHLLLLFYTVTGNSGTIWTAKRQKIPFLLCNLLAFCSIS